MNLRHGPDRRRALQLVLAAIWLLDGALQFQPWMYSHSFSQMLSESAAGNPGFIVEPITWTAGLVARHDAILSTLFAATQVLLGLGIAYRRSVRVALAASVAWSLAVWWLGEGFGGLLNATANPVTGAPGAVLLYAVLAILLWPADRAPDAPFTAARYLGPNGARALWLLLWLGYAGLALTPANRAPMALGGALGGMADGEPGWLATTETHVAALVGMNGTGVSLGLAEVFVMIAIGGVLSGTRIPRRFAIAALTLAIAVAAAIWALGEAFGGILTGNGTDPNTGPLLILLALAYWPRITLKWAQIEGSGHDVVHARAFNATVLTRLHTWNFKGGHVPVWYDPKDRSKVVVDYETREFPETAVAQSRDVD